MRYMSEFYQFGIGPKLYMAVWETRGRRSEKSQQQNISRSDYTWVHSGGCVIICPNSQLALIIATNAISADAMQ